MRYPTIQSCHIHTLTLTNKEQTLHKLTFSCKSILQPSHLPKHCSSLPNFHSTDDRRSPLSEERRRKKRGKKEMRLERRGITSFAVYSSFACSATFYCFIGRFSNIHFLFSVEAFFFLVEPGCDFRFWIMDTVWGKGLVRKLAASQDRFFGKATHNRDGGGDKREMYIIWSDLIWCTT